MHEKLKIHKDMAANNLITLTLKDSSSTVIELNTGDLISLVGSSSDTDSIVKAVYKGQNQNLLVDETPTAIAALTSDLIGLTLVEDATVTYFANAERVRRVTVDGSGSDVFLDDNTSAWGKVDVTESQSAVKALVNNASGDTTGALTEATATADGLTTGLLTGASQFVQVTSASADNIIALPITTSVPVGTVIQGYVGANGFEFDVEIPGARAGCGEISQSNLCQQRLCSGRKDCVHTVVK